MNPMDRNGRGRRVRKRLVPARGGPTILLVEDDFEMRRIVATALQREGFSVVEARDGDEALEWLGPGVLDGAPDRLPALVISDIRMPHFSGLEILQAVQVLRRKVPVILVTAFGDPETHALARELGAHRVLDKPFEIADLLAAVRGLLGSSPWN